jgi:hypothetical protein
MPNLIKGLTDVKESAGTILFCFKRCVDGVAKAMYLLNGRVFMPKSKLVVRYPLCIPFVGGNSIGK